MVLDKQLIKQKVADKIATLQISANIASKQIGISGATLNNVINETWLTKPELSPSDGMWRKLAIWAGMRDGWNTAVTNSYKRIFALCNKCQKEQISRPISSVPGSGKSHPLKEYAQSYPNVYYIECEEYYTKKVFLNMLRQKMGLIDTGYETGMSIHEMVTEIIDHLNSLANPLVIIDEADKLKDGVINFFKTFYNKTNAGYVLSGAPYFQKRILKGVRLQKQSYQEIFSRLGGEFLSLGEIDKDSIEQICEANGLTSSEDKNIVWNKSNNDLRRVKVEILNLRTKHQLSNN